MSLQHSLYNVTIDWTSGQDLRNCWVTACNQKDVSAVK